MINTLQYLEEQYKKSKDPNLKMAIDEIVWLNELLSNALNELHEVELKLVAADK